MKTDKLLDVAKEAVHNSLKLLSSLDVSSLTNRLSEDIPREIKSSADTLLEECILERLTQTKLPILSEESGYIQPKVQNGRLMWVVDPLDGTVNYIRGLGVCGISIALWDGNRPVFGVIGEYPSMLLAWGGKNMGSYVEGRSIKVAPIKAVSESIICTGFPVRFDYEPCKLAVFMEIISSYSKVRMLGAASISLLRIAQGAADVYAESNVMIWDVAAGLALVEGANGSIDFSPGPFEHCFDVYASNGLRFKTEGHINESQL